MATVYVTPGLGTGNNDGTTAANAFRSLTAFAAAGCAAGSDVRMNRSEGILFGATSTRIDITNPSGTTFRYTWDGTGTDPNFATNLMAVNDSIVINSSNFNAGNNGTFLVTAVTDDYFEIANAAGVAENDKLLSAATSIKFNDSSTAAVAFTNSISGTVGANTSITGYSTDWNTKTLQYRNGTGSGANTEGMTFNAVVWVILDYIEIKNYTRDGIRGITGASGLLLSNCSLHNNGNDGIGGGSAAAGLSILHLYNCVFYNNTRYGVLGASGSLTLIQRCLSYGNLHGAAPTSTGLIHAQDSIFYGNTNGCLCGTSGVEIYKNCVFDGNTTGINAGSSTTNNKQFHQCRITNNTTGFAPAAAVGTFLFDCAFYGNTTRVSAGLSQERNCTDMATDGYVDSANRNYNLINGASPAECRWTEAGVGDATNKTYLVVGLAANPDMPTAANVCPPDTTDGVLGTFVESDRNTDPGEANVANGTDYKICNVDKTGSFVAGYIEPTTTVEGSLTFVQAIRLILAATAGDVTTNYTAAKATATIKAAGGTDTRITADVARHARDVTALDPDTGA